MTAREMSRSGMPAPRLTVMAAVARNGVIGDNGTIPWRLSADLRRFKATTMGAVLVMGRRTYESIGRPLPGRTTVVVTTQRPYPATGACPPGLLIARTFEEAMRTARAQAGAGAGEVFVQGGAAVYAAALPLADRLLVTWVDAEPAGDTFFPPVDWSAWREESREDFAGGTWATYVRL